MAFWEKSVTVNQIEFADLFQPDIQDKEARSVSIKTSGGKIDRYMASYNLWRREYRNSYSQQWLERMGFSPMDPGTGYTASELDLTAMVPLKIDGAVTTDPAELRNIDKALKKFNIGGEAQNELMDQITTGENADIINNVYIMEGIPGISLHPSVIKALFNSLLHYKPLLESAGVIGMSSPSVTFQYYGSITVYTEPGSIGSTGSYWSNAPGIADDYERYADVIESGKAYKYPTKGGQVDMGHGMIPGPGEGGIGNAGVLLQLYRQDTTTSFTRIETNLQMVLNVSGVSLQANISSAENKFRLIAPRGVIEGLKFKDWVCAHERSFMMLIYATQEVELAWYQVPVVQWLFIIVVTLLTLGTGTAAVAAGTMTAKALGGALFRQFFFMAIAHIVSKKLEGNLRSGMLASLVLMVVKLYAKDPNFLSSLGTNFLPLAQEVVAGAMIVNKYQDAIDLEEAHELEEEMEKEEKELERKENIENASNPDMAYMPMPADMSSHYSYMDINNPDTFYAKMYGTTLYNYDNMFDVEQEVGLRLQVKPG